MRQKNRNLEVDGCVSVSNNGSLFLAARMKWMDDSSVYVAVAQI
jgi:hypothetical protein